MIYQMKQNEHTQNQFSNAIKELQVTVHTLLIRYSKNDEI